ncbi:MAG: T9SS type A sorting domain-containing protein [Sphingobacteriaceae bacterium]|nr:T9SS type A sorting domain-containing protein [Sphingobacteriaceae bacterium]
MKNTLQFKFPFKIYPNPSSKTIHIQNFGGNAISDLVIIDVTGRKVLEQKENISEIDIQHLNKGVYQILITSEGKMHPCKFIKQ